jgi:hypothetical protein
MGIENSLEGLNLSASVWRVAEKYLEHESVRPAQVVNDLLEQHPDYGGGLAGKIGLSEELKAGEAAIDDLLRAAADLYTDRVDLHTRLAVIGLVLNQPELIVGGMDLLLPALARELHEPLESILTENGLNRWKYLVFDRTASGSAGPASEPGTGDSPTQNAQSAARQQKGDPSGDIAQQASPTPATPPAASPEQIRTALRALADTPTLANDSLRFADYADALVEFIDNEGTGKPITIGIDAAWGMGKTSLMYMVRKRLDPGSLPASGAGSESGAQTSFERYRTVWFNAWKYDREEALWAALALEILAQTRKRSTARQRLRTWVALNRERFDWGLFLQDTLAAIAKPLLLLLLGAALFIAGAFALHQPLDRWIPLAAAVAVSGVYGIGTTAFKYVAAPFHLNIARYMRTPNYAEKIGFLSEFEADFRRVVRVVTKKGKWPLVVFVDDLDRCGPTQAVEVVEAINSVLDTEHCIFILGMDAQTVAASIVAKYRDMNALLGEDPGGLTLGERFLEKIIQVNFRIPPAEKTVVDGYIGRILAGGGPTPEPVATGVREAEQLIKAEQRSGKTLDAAAEAVGKTKAADSDVKQAKERIGERSFTEAEQVRLAIVEAAPYLDFNPRKIKRFINIFRLQALVAQKRGMLADPAEATLLARALIIATRWPDLVAGLIPDRGYVDRLLDVETMRSKLDETFVEEWGEGEKRLKADLDRSLENPRLKRLVGAADLIALLNAMSKEQRARLADYLVLARTAAPVAT